MKRIKIQLYIKQQDVLIYIIQNNIKKIAFILNFYVRIDIFIFVDIIDIL